MPLPGARPQQTPATAQYLQTTCVYGMPVYKLPGGLVLFQASLLLAVHHLLQGDAKEVRANRSCLRVAMVRV